ncbi:alpha-taxilin-like isoform X1 [Papaver somniferum]|uniref:alpha-taxilin-like isoform X1 n=1 Tax=Papaver somniferum TaxID=3469 RepID=UPI000E6F66D1|nr:alpha-taxilin-like isoform X1 [Papaver somniferum]
MEKSQANQLPEVDSLPDGFFESSNEQEQQQPRTTHNFEHEESPPSPPSPQSPPDYKDTILELDQCSDAVLDTSDTSTVTDSRNDVKVEKLRTFPVALSEKDGEDSIVNRSFVENTECGSIGFTSDSGNGHQYQHFEGSSENSLKERKRPLLTLDLHLITSFSPTPSIHLPPAFKISSRLGFRRSSSALIFLHLSATAEGSELSAAETAESLKNKKLETSDVKRKSVKRGFKTEREFLEFTLQYQQVIAERDAAISVRDKLESLCRELQRQNKLLMDECKRVSTEGQNMRSELSTKFHHAIKDVSSKLKGQKDECLLQLKENEMLRNKLKHLCDQYTVSEQQFTHKIKQKSLELQIADLKIQQHEEKSNQEKTQMKLYAEQLSQLLATEKNLRLQLSADGEKFQNFQDALLKSNEVFETFKQEIEKMGKSIKELKKENIFLKSKCEKTDVTLRELVGEREHMKKQLEKLKNQKEKLESLCRSLQAQRKQSLAESSSCCDAVSVASSMEGET